MSDTRIDGVHRIEGLGTAGSASGGVASVQGVAGGTALPISAAALPLPAGAATEVTLLTRASEATVATLATEATAATLATEATVATLATEATAATLATEATVATLATEATVATLATQTTAEAILAALGGSEGTWGTAKTWAGATADTEPPTVFVDLGDAANFCNFKVAITAFGGTVAATQCYLRMWTRSGGAGGVVTKAWERLYDASLLLATTTEATSHVWEQIVPCHADEVAFTMTFVDGTAPTVTGNVYARGVGTSGLQRSDLDWSSDGRTQVVQSKAYDTVTGTDKNTPAWSHADLYGAEAVSQSGTGVVTATYSFTMGQVRNQLAFQIAVTAAAAISFRFEQVTGTDIQIVTPSGFNARNRTYLDETPAVANGQPCSSAGELSPVVGGGATGYCIYFNDLCCDSFNLVVTATSNAGNSLAINTASRFA